MCIRDSSLPCIFNFSTPSEWNKLDEHLQLFGKVVKPIASNGYCFVESVRAVMNHNQQKKIGFPELKDKILDEMYDNVDFYVNFHASSAKVSKQQLLKDAEEFFNDGRNYVMNIVDVWIAATANAIKHNLYIFENLGGQAVIIQQLCR